jgi:hypothetical protein
MAWEVVEAALVSCILVGFVAFALIYATPLQGPAAYTPPQQPQLMNLAQQALDRVVLVNGRVFARDGGRWAVADLALSAPRPLYQPQIDETKLSLLQALADAGTAGPLCAINQKAFVDETGIERAILVGFGVLRPASTSAHFDYACILRNFFGGDWDKYDIELVIKPLVNLTICPNVRVAGVDITRRDPVCSGVPQGRVFVRSTAGGRVVVTGMRCEVEAGCDVFSYDLSLTYANGVWQAEVPLPPSAYAGLCDTAGLALIAQKVDYPRASDLFVFNATSRSLAYGMYGPDGKLWLLHDHTVSCGTGSTPALGIRELDVYTGAGFVTLVNGAVLDPGVGGGNVKVDACQSCTKNARCAACWVEPPANAIFAVAWVERESQGKKDSAPRSVMLLVPLAPAQPQSAIRIGTWHRWTPREPELQSAVATRIVDGQTTTYQLRLVLYRRP